MPILRRRWSTFLSLWERIEVGLTASAILRSACASGSLLKLKSCLHSQRRENSQHEVGGNIVSISIENCCDARPRCAGQPGDLCMSQVLFADYFDNLIVQLTTDFDLQAVGRRKS